MIAKNIRILRGINNKCMYSQPCVYRIKMRCHCLTWGKEKYIQSWVQHMNAHQLHNALDKRITGVMNHTRGL